MLDCGLVRRFSDEQWIKDVEFLIKKIERKHPNPFIKLSRKEFTEQFLKLIDEIPFLSDDEIYFRIAACVCNIGDMHTQVLFDEEKEVYPFVFSKFDDSIRVVKTSEELQDILGAELIAINCKSISDIFYEIKKVIPQENGVYVEEKALEYLIYPGILHIAGLEKKGKMCFQFIDMEGKHVEKEVYPKIDLNLLSLKTIAAENKYILNVPRGAHIRLPYWSEYIEEKKALYVRYAACFDGEFARQWGLPYWNEYPNFDHFIYDILCKLNTHEIDKFIFDLRGNVGGNIEFTERIFKRLISNSKWNEELNSKEKFYVLINSRVYSCGVTTCLYIKEHTNATFIGEATGGNVVIFSVNVGDDFYLPNSNMKIRCSSAVTKLCKSETTGNFKPDVEIKNSFKNHLEGREQVLEYVMNI